MQVVAGIVGGITGGGDAAAAVGVGTMGPAPEYPFVKLRFARAAEELVAHFRGEVNILGVLHDIGNAAAIALVPVCSDACATQGAKGAGAIALVACLVYRARGGAAARAVPLLVPVLAPLAGGVEAAERIAEAAARAVDAETEPKPIIAAAEGRRALEEVHRKVEPWIALIPPEAVAPRRCVELVGAYLRKPFGTATEEDADELASTAFAAGRVELDDPKHADAARASAHLAHAAVDLILGEPAGAREQIAAARAALAALAAARAALAALDGARS